MVTRTLYSLLFTGILTVCLVSSVVAQELQLATEGRTDYTIFVGTDATEAEEHAADELAHFLGEVTGAQFPVVKNSDTITSRPAIVVGPGALAHQVAPELRFDDLYPDGIIIESRGNDLVFAGDRPRGTLYAVYTFLEDTVGIGWWAPDATTIPSLPTLTVPAQQVRYVPILENRDTSWYVVWDMDWAARNKVNGNRTQLDEQRGGRHTWAVSHVHTFNRLIPPQEYFPRHPEWFSEINGQRVGGDGERVQLCLTNEELKAYITQKAQGWLDANPEATLLSISQNDWHGECQCAECNALKEHEGSSSGPMLHFVNYVAERIADSHPHVAVTTLAYQYTRQPPNHVRQLPNVIVRLCSIECNFLEPLEGPSNESFANDIRVWSEISDRLYIWDYTTNYSHYILPHPNLRVLAPNMRFFVNHGVKGIYEQGASMARGAEFAELKGWLIGKLMWNPDLDTTELINRFVNGYYGDAGPYVEQYINYLHDRAEASDVYLRTFSPVNASFLDLDFAIEAERLFNLAEAAVADQPEVLNRVQVARLPVRYLWAMQWFTFETNAQLRDMQWPGPESYEYNVQTFLEVARNNDIERVSERNRIEFFEERANRLMNIERKPAPPPPGCEDLPRDRYFELPSHVFLLSREGVAATLVGDPRASDGITARMPGDHKDWAVKGYLSGVELDPDATYSVYASISCETIGTEGQAFAFGVYDTVAARGLGGGGMTAAAVPDAEYHTYKIATTPLNNRVYIWVAPPQNPENIKSVSVDRIWVVREEN